MDRVDKVLLVLPFLPAFDLVSTLFSLRFGGEEIGILARPMLKIYGTYGLVALAASASVIFLVSMTIVLYIRKLSASEEWQSGWTLCALAVPIYWFFMLEGVYVSTVVMNLLLPISPFLAETMVLRVILVGAYFAGVAALTLSQMKRQHHF